jgi:HSP20 family protein
MALWNRELIPSRWSERALSPFTDIDDIFDRFRRDYFLPDIMRGSMEAMGPRVEVQETDKNIFVSAEIPGMREKDINVSLRDDNLIIEGERKSEKKKEGNGYYRSEFSYGSFYRCIPLDIEVDKDKVEATYRNGILEVTLNKLAESEHQTKRIEVKH